MQYYDEEDEDEDEEEESEDEDDLHQENIFNQQNAFGMQVYNQRAPRAAVPSSSVFGAPWGFGAPTQSQPA